MKTVFLPALLLSVSAYGAHGWGRYESIIDRSPFGQEPPIVEEKADPIPKIHTNLAKAYRVSCLYSDSQGVAKAGFVYRVDNSSYFLREGESLDDGLLTLVDIDFDMQAVLLRSGEAEMWILLEGTGGPKNAPSLDERLAQRGPLGVLLEERDKKVASAPPQLPRHQSSQYLKGQKKWVERSDSTPVEIVDPALYRRPTKPTQKQIVEQQIKLNQHGVLPVENLLGRRIVGVGSARGIAVR